MSRFDNIIAVAPTGYGADALYLTQGRRVYSTSSWLVVPSGLSDVIRIAAAWRHGLALRADGTVVEFGEYGNSVPAGLSGVSEIAVGARHSLALLSNGSLVAWAYGDGAVPQLMPQLSGVQKIAVGDSFAMALLSDSTVTIWGNHVPVIGSGFTSEYSGPLKVLPTATIWGNQVPAIGSGNTPQGVTKISAQSGSFAILSQGRIGFSGFRVGFLDGTYSDVYCSRIGITTYRNGSLGRLVFLGDFVESPVSGIPAQLSGLEIQKAYNSVFIDVDGSVRGSGDFASFGPLVVPELAGVPVAAGSLTVAASLDRGLEGLVCEASVNASLSALLQGERAFAVSFEVSCSATATLAGTRAALLSVNFSAASRVVVRDPVTILISNLEHTYNGAPKSAAVVVSPVNVPATIRYSGNGYDSTVGPVNAGTYSVEASVDTEFYFGIASGVLRIQKAAQAIAFGPIAPRMVGDPPLSLFASSTSGLPITYSSSSPLIASLSGNRLFAVGAGTALITASQAGNSNYFVASPVSQAISISVSRPVIDATQSIIAWGVGRDFSFQFRASNNPKEWIIGPGGVLPTGFLFDPLTGVLTGAGVLPGVWRLPMIAVNEGGQSDTVVFTVGIFDVPSREIVKKVLINTLTWAVSMPDPAAAITDMGGNSVIKTTQLVNGATVETTTTSAAKVTLAAAVGQARYGDDLTLHLAFTESAPASGGVGAAVPVEFTPPLISAKFSIKGYDTDPAFLITDEQAFRKRTIYSSGAYRTIYALNVSLRSDALLGFLSDFETEQGTQANCICELELIFSRGYGSALSGVDRITTQPFLMRISRDTV